MAFADTYDAPAMATPKNSVPTYADLARTGAVLQRTLQSAAWTRLQRLVTRLSDVDVRLSFSIGEPGVPEVEGSADMQCRIPCQWCADPVAKAVSVSFDYWVTGSETEAAALTERRRPGDPEVVLVDTERLDPVELLEDELILQLPTRVCTEVNCPKRPAASYGVDLEPAEAAQGPFAALAVLRDESGEDREPPVEGS